MFPAPLEVNRLFYRNGDPYIFHPLFPAPREVDRDLYGLINKVRVTAEEFPAPPEVDRCPIPHFDYGAVDCYCLATKSTCREPR